MLNLRNLCQIIIAFLRLILWFLFFHIGVDFWLFPNYFIDSNNPIDLFVPFLSWQARDDRYELRTLILRLASLTGLVYFGREFLTSADPDLYLSTLSDLNSEVFEWGQNKFLGVVSDD